MNNIRKLIKEAVLKNLREARSGKKVSVDKTIEGYKIIFSNGKGMTIPEEKLIQVLEKLKERGYDFVFDVSAGQDFDIDLYIDLYGDFMAEFEEAYDMGEEEDIGISREDLQNMMYKQGLDYKTQDDVSVKDVARGFDYDSLSDDISLSDHDLYVDKREKDEDDDSFDDEWI